MNTPTPVTIVRPKTETPKLLGWWIGSAISYFLNAWLIMLVVGAQTPWNTGYWQTVALLIAIRLVMNAGKVPNHLFWTRETPK